MEKFIIIDGNAILHRAFHAMPPLTTSTGRLVNAVYGFASMLLKLSDGFRPEYMAVTFDLPKPTFRKKMFADYQIKRPKMDEGLVGQIETVKEMVRVLGIPIYEKEGFEADDVIGTLAKQATNKQQTTNNKQQNNDLETIIVTGDRDILQLVNEHVKVYMPVKGITEAVLYDKEKVVEKFGIPPELIPDYKGLVGDQSDNYPGVEGIGPKTAENLLKKYGSFANLFQCIKTLKQEQPAVAEKLEKGRESGEMSHQLATIIKNVPVTLDLENCRIKDFDRPEVVEFFEGLGFKSLLRRLNKQQTTNNKQQEQIGNKRKVEVTDENQMSLFL